MDSSSSRSSGPTRNTSSGAGLLAGPPRATSKQNDLRRMSKERAVDLVTDRIRGDGRPPQNALRSRILRRPQLWQGGFPEDRAHCGLRDHHQLPGAAGGVVVVARGVGRGHREISGSATGLTSRPSAGMCPLTQVPSASASRTAANIRFCRCESVAAMATGNAPLRVRPAVRSSSPSITFRSAKATASPQTCGARLMSQTVTVADPAFALAIAAGGAAKSAKTTRLLTGQEWIESLRKAQGSQYRPAR